MLKMTCLWRSSAGQLLLDGCHFYSDYPIDMKDSCDLAWVALGFESSSVLEVRHLPLARSGCQADTLGWRSACPLPCRCSLPFSAVPKTPWTGRRHSLRLATTSPTPTPSTSSAARRTRPPLTASPSRRCSR